MTVVLEKTLKLKGIEPRYPIVQGGMGVGISLYDLASAVGKEGGIGTVSSAALDQLVARRLKRDRMDLVEATAIEIADTKRDAGVAAINIMCALFSSYNKSVEGAIKGGVDVIISGAGLPTSLPSLVEKITGKKDHGINLIPIVSSDRALEIICKKWSAQGYRPDAVVLEGPKAGGHLGWNYNQVKDAGENFLKEYDLFEKLFGPVMDVAAKYPNDFGPIPVIVAGGIYTHDDIVDALKCGAAGVQMGTRFAVTDESGGSVVFKNSILNARKDDIVVATEDWGSPCKLPFRYIKTSPLALKEKKGNSFCICTTLMKCAGMDNSDKLGAQYPPRCPEQYVLLPGKVCPANGAVDYTELVTCGSEGYRVDKIVSTKELMAELIGNK